jgi:hypothetical protein
MNTFRALLLAVTVSLIAACASTPKTTAPAAAPAPPPPAAVSVAGKFSFNVNAQGMDLKIDFVGTSDGQTMAGKAVFGSFGEGTFKGKRA